jgi:hypothetical protein
MKKLKPLEVTYRFHGFGSPLLVSEQLMYCTLGLLFNPHKLVYVN